jgi:hypothetical protein
MEQVYTPEVAGAVNESVILPNACHSEPGAQPGEESAVSGESPPISGRVIPYISALEFSTALMFIRHIFLSGLALSFYKVSL